MSLFDPSMPKKECQIQISCVATASSITVQPPLWPLCWECALETIMYDDISYCIHKDIKLSLYKHLMCIIESVIRLWKYTFILFVLNILGHRGCAGHTT